MSILYAPIFFNEELKILLSANSNSKSESLKLKLKFKSQLNPELLLSPSIFGNALCCENILSNKLLNFNDANKDHLRTKTVLSSYACNLKTHEYGKSVKRTHYRSSVL